MQNSTHAVGIDLGTTFSCLAYLNSHGEPVTLANPEGELSTPSVVMFDGDEPVVGTEALRNAILKPDEVIQNSKRFIGTPGKYWTIHGRKFTPVDVAALILKKLIASAQSQIGLIEHAVITVPAQFTDAQRNATIKAGLAAGLSRVDIINEPVAAALCHVLGTEGLWFDELAKAQTIMVYDLGGGTLDLSLVRYEKNEVVVSRSTGDLHLGGIDWTSALRDAIADQFTKEFGNDPREDPESLQALTLEAEQAKRSLTVREKAALTCVHGGHRKTYQVLRDQFERVAGPLLKRAAKVTEDLIRDDRGKVRWGQVDVVLTTGGSSRMPMVREQLNTMSGTTINSSLSPDQSIAHGAAYYAGMLLTNDKFARTILGEEASRRLSQVRQRNVNARALGILVRDMETGKRVPHFVIPPHTPLPADFTNVYGTVRPDQRRVRLQIVEGGNTAQTEPVVLGTCVIDDLPPNLREGSRVAVRIRYDEQARVHVDARDVASGKTATAEIIRAENLLNQIEQHEGDNNEGVLLDDPENSTPPSKPTPPAAPQPNETASTPRPRSVPKPRSVPQPRTGATSKPSVPTVLCRKCGEAVGEDGRCTACGAVNSPTSAPKPPAPKKTAAKLPPINDEEIIDLTANSSEQPKPSRKPKSRPIPKPKRVVKKVVRRKKGDDNPEAAGEEEFWRETGRE